MEQLGELRELYAEFEERDVAILGISSEERNMMDHANVIGELGFMPEWDLVTDIGYRHDAYERTTAYFVERTGEVRQVFPMEIYDRPPWWAILNEIDRLDDEAKGKKKKGKSRRSSKRKNSRGR